MWCKVILWALSSLALWSSPASASAVDASPLGKVIDLLGELSHDIVSEGDEDEALYRAYTKFYRNQSATALAIIKKQEDKIEQLQADLKEAGAFREGKRREFDDITGKLTQNGIDLSDGKESRKKEEDLFEKNELTYISSVDQLDRALSTMEKKAPDNAASASLLSVAENLNQLLVKNSDIMLSTRDHDILDRFMRAARAAQWPAPSFLQTGSRGPFGEFKSRAGGLVGTLQDLLVKVKKEKDAALEAEQKAKANFEEFKTGLESKIAADEKNLADVKMSIAQSEIQSSKDKTSLMESQDIRDEEKVHLEQIETEFRERTQAYKVRLGKRADEQIAVHEAQRVLTTEVARSYIKIQRIGIAEAKNATRLLQVSKRNQALRKRVLHVLHHATTPALALLVLRSTESTTSNGDTFKEVKTMIQGMLQRLSEQEAKESTHAAFCDREMGTTGLKKQYKKAAIDKLESRLDAVSAELVQTEADIATAQKDLAKLIEAIGDAQRIRNKEKADIAKTIKQYKDAAVLLKKGSDILRSYYQNKDGGGSEVKKKEFKHRHGLGNSIIHLLEVAIDDFQALYQETKQAEEAAEKDFRETNQESLVRKAVFSKDLEWKSSSAVALRHDKHELTNDLKTAKKELTNMDNYFEKLQRSCAIKGPTYAERKTRRDSSLRSLKEALDYLTSA